jgi:hypothetical protein
MRLKLPVSISWTYHWMARKKKEQELLVKRIKRSELQRLAHTCQALLRPWYERLNELYKKYNFHLGLVINFDETSLHLNSATLSLVCFPADVDPLPHPAPRRTANVTLITFIAANNTVLLSVMLWPGASVPDELALLSSPIFHVVPNRSGWATKADLLTIFQNFVFGAIADRRKALKLPETAPALLLFDSHSSRNQLELWEMAAAEHIVGFPLIPHTSGRTQPLDVKYHAIFKTAFNANFKVPESTDPSEHKTALAVAVRDAHGVASLTRYLSESFVGSGTLPGGSEAVLRSLPDKSPYPDVLVRKRTGPEFPLGGKVLTDPDVQEEWRRFLALKADKRTPIAAAPAPVPASQADAAAPPILVFDDDESAHDSTASDVDEESESRSEEPSSRAAPAGGQQSRKRRERRWATVTKDLRHWRTPKLATSALSRADLAPGESAPAAVPAAAPRSQPSQTPKTPVPTRSPRSGVGAVRRPVIGPQERLQRRRTEWQRLCDDAAPAFVSKKQRQMDSIDGLEKLRSAWRSATLRTARAKLVPGGGWLSDDSSENESASESSTSSSYSPMQCTEAAACSGSRSKKVKDLRGGSSTPSPARPPPHPKDAFPIRSLPPTSRSIHIGSE